MGRHNLSKKIKDKICSNCINQCKHYLDSGISPFSPKRRHKTHEMLNSDITYKNLYSYCIHYKIPQEDT